MVLWVMQVYSVATGQTLFDMITTDTIKIQIQCLIENDLYFSKAYFI